MNQLQRASRALDPAFLRATLCSLVRINSVNPSLDPGAPGERAIARFVASLLAQMGLEVRQHEPSPGRVSVVGRLPGKGSGPSLMLNAHTDTVGVVGMSHPFQARVRQGRLFGRGALDMKASLAACLAALRALVDSDVTPAGDLLLAAVADEEHSSLGTSDLIPRYPVEGAIVTEPTALGICLAHKGFVWLEVETVGRAAHGSRPGQGVDANLRMGRFLGLLEGLERALRQRPGHPLLGPPSLHAARLEGGTAPSVYAARCRLQIERRTLPGEGQAGVLAEIQDLVDQLRRQDPAFEARVRVRLERAPFETSPDSPLAGCLRRATRQVLGREAPFTGEGPWMDAALLQAAGVDTVVLGPSGEGAHSDEEWVDLESVEQLAHILLAAVLEYGQGSPS